MSRYGILTTTGLALAAMLLAAPARARDDREVEQRVAAEPRGEVTINIVSGSVEVQGWDRNEVEVTGSLNAGVERLDVLREGNRVTIKAVVPKSSARRIDADLAVRVPVASNLEVTTVSADIDTRGVSGPLRLRSVSGEIGARDAASDSELKSVSGDLRVGATGTPIRLRATSVSGSIIIDDLAGELEAVSVSGDLLLDLGAVANARVRTTAGDTRFGARLAKGARVDYESVSGDLTMKLGAETGFVAEAQTFSGELSNCFGVKAEPTSKYGPGERLTVTRGEGSARVRVQTMSGDVRICDR